MYRLKSFLAIIAIGAVVVSDAAFAGDADFTIVNKTGYVIKEIFISPASKSKWGNDRMGEEVLGDSESRLFKFSDKASCTQDIKLVFDPSDVEIIVENIDLCSIDKFSVKYNASSKKVSWVTE